jgi:hypothetical protein
LVCQPEDRLIRIVWLAIAIGSADSVSAPDSGPMMTAACSCWTHFLAISSDCAALDWLLNVM